MTNQQTAVVTRSIEPAELSALTGWSREQLELIKRTVAKGATDNELALFGSVCQRLGLNPFIRQVYLIPTWDSEAKAEVKKPHIAVDGWRLLAARTGDYDGQVGPEWCGPDGAWREVWLEKEPPAACRVGILRRGWASPVWGIATFRSFAKRGRDGSFIGNWGTMPDHMLSVRAETQALRKAFPATFSEDLEVFEGEPTAAQRATIIPAAVEDLYPSEETVIPPRRAIPAPQPRATPEPEPAAGGVSQAFRARLEESPPGAEPIQGELVGASPDPTAKASARQIRDLQGLAGRTKHSPQDLADIARDEYGAQRLADLTAEQATDLLRDLMEREGWGS